MNKKRALTIINTLISSSTDNQVCEVQDKPRSVKCVLLNAKASILARPQADVDCERAQFIRHGVATPLWV